MNPISFSLKNGKRKIGVCTPEIHFPFHPFINLHRNPAPPFFLPFHFLISLLSYSLTFHLSMPSVDTSNNNAEHSKPIPIENHRRRSHSVSEASSSDSSISPSSPITPTSPLYPRVGGAVSPSSSPILSYFLAQSPNKSPAATFPFRRGFGAPVIEGKLHTHAYLRRQNQNVL